MNMSRMTPLCGNLHRAVAAGRLWTEIAADLRRSRGRFVLWDSHSCRLSAADESPFPEACDDVDLAMPIEEEPVLGVEGLGPWVLLEDPQVRGSCADGQIHQRGGHTGAAMP